MEDVSTWVTKQTIMGHSVKGFAKIQNHDV